MALFTGTVHAQPQNDPAAAVLTQARDLTRAAVASVMPINGASDLVSVANDLFRSGVRRALIERAVVDPSTGLGQGATQHQLTVVAEKGEASARARFYLPLAPDKDFIVTLTAPISGGQTAFATDKGLGQNVTIDVSLKLNLWSKTVRVGAVDQRTVTALADATQSGGALGASDRFLTDLELLRRAAATRAAGPAVVQAVAQAPKVARLLSSPTLVASPERFYAAVAQQLPELVKARWAAFLTPGFESVRNSVDYFTTATTEPKSFEDTTQLFTFSGGVSLTHKWTPKSGAEILTPLLFAGLSARAGNAARIPDKHNVCFPLAEPASALECLEAPIGEPTTSRFTSVTLEYRQWAYDQSIGFNPKFTYSTQRPDGSEGKSLAVKTFEVPIYFIHQVKDLSVSDLSFGPDLAGGINIGWRDEGERSGPFFTLFLTKAFGLP
jgi:hypothetical protein